MPLAKVIVSLRPAILDAQGQTVKTALNHLGFPVQEVRIGKYIELDLPPNIGEAEVRSMCERLLANPVLEDFRVEVQES